MEQQPLHGCQCHTHTPPPPHLPCPSLRRRPRACRTLSLHGGATRFIWTCTCYVPASSTSPPAPSHNHATTLSIGSESEVLQIYYHCRFSLAIIMTILLPTVLLLLLNLQITQLLMVLFSTPNLN